MFSWLRGSSKKEEIKLSVPQALEILHSSSDFLPVSIGDDENIFVMSYYKSLIDAQDLQEQFICSVKRARDDIKTLEDLKTYIPYEDVTITSDGKEVMDKLLEGYVAFQIYAEQKECALIKVLNIEGGFRTENDTENEFSVTGPKLGFVEDLDMNLYMLRKTFVTEKLSFKEVSLGNLSKSRIVIVYVEGITNKKHIENATERINNIDFDVVFDGSLLDQLLSDNQNTPFPLFLGTERIDRAIQTLINGQLVIFTSGSPYAITGPSSLFDFFISPEDYYLPWMIGSFLRVTRFFAVAFSIFATSMYVAVLTFHYEMIPKDLLGPLVYSRANVPFPPVLEVLFLEITIELLREAGARLPTKIGQTLGIVGGIVIGQASVEASLTSSVLLIIVALAALASFTTPTSRMSNTIRLLRFPFIILAAFLGGLGIVIGIVFLLVHLMRLQSLTSPYLAPLYPFRSKDMWGFLFRPPYNLSTARPAYLRPLSKWRYNPKRGNKTKEIDKE
ncbi:spore germination protein [Priestia endophytica]|uniref:spore germination protein n=1 Tax=Priestia endophytica TaxID=135735 RepID=UPI0020403583|nr:spore germination protein [Priestia endophytica]MCM3536752.1 spore germination protein [Priestia endophytica]